MESVLVTGGAGFIGSNLVDALVKLKQPVVVLDNFDQYYSPSIKRRNLIKARASGLVTLIVGDIRDEACLRKIFKTFSIFKVVHLAALAGVGPSIKTPKLYEEVNIGGTLNLLEAARRVRVSQFVFASSSSVYGAQLKGPFKETDGTDKPLSPYAASKKAAELMCGVYANIYRMPVTVVRIFNAYGPRNRPDMACYRFIEALAEDEPLEVFGNGMAGRDYTYVGDIVAGILNILEKPVELDTVNLGRSSPVTIIDLIRAMEKVTGKKAKIHYFDSRRGDVPLTFADISHARKVYGWRPEEDWSWSGAAVFVGMVF